MFSLQEAQRDAALQEQRAKLAAERARLEERQAMLARTKSTPVFSAVAREPGMCAADSNCAYVCVWDDADFAGMLTVSIVLLYARLFTRDTAASIFYLFVAGTY